MTQSELAMRLNTTEKRVSQLVNGDIELDEDLIRGLSIALGTSGLSERHKEEKQKIVDEKSLAEEEMIARKMDFQYWVNLGVVEKTSDWGEKVAALKKYFRISTLNILAKDDFLVQYKTAVKTVTEKNIINSNAWVQTAINVGNVENVNPIDLEYLKSKLPEIRKMTLEEQDEFFPKLKTIFENSGVAFVLLPNLKNCGVNGAVKWFGDNRILLALNDRGKYADYFWFALFHEIKHIFQKKKGHLIVTPTLGNVIASQLNLEALEQEADDFARNYLIKRKDYEDFISQGSVSKQSIIDFANKIEIHPGIVVGLLQRDGHVRRDWHNDLKVQYQFK